MTNQKFTLPQEEELKEKALELIAKCKKEGISLREAAGVDSEILEEIYSLGYSHYSLGNYEDAKGLFFLLSGLEPSEPRYIYALGSTFYQLKVYEEAIPLFAMSLTQDNQHVEAAFYLADALVRTGQVEHALQVYDLVVEMAPETGVWAPLRQRALRIKETLIK